MVVRSLLRGAARAFAIRPQSVPRRSYAPEAVIARALATADLATLAPHGEATPADQATTPAAPAHVHARWLRQLKSSSDVSDRLWTYRLARHLAAAESHSLKVLPTGSFGLDVALGIGGLPLGAVVDVSGAPGTGKTTLALHAIAEAQRHGRYVGLIDLNRGFNPEYASQVGVDVEGLVVVRPADLSEALEAARKLVESEGLDLLVVDSGDSFLSARPSWVSDFVQPWRRLTLRRLRNDLVHSHTTAMFLHDFRWQSEEAGEVFAQYSRALQAYNRAWNRYSSVRLAIEAVEIWGDTAEAFRRRSRVTVRKNELSPGLGEAEIEIVPGQGIDREADLVDKAIEKGLIVEGESGLEFEGENLGPDRDAAIKFLRVHGDMFARIARSLLPRV